VFRPPLLNKPNRPPEHEWRLYFLSISSLLRIFRVSKLSKTLSFYLCEYNLSYKKMGLSHFPTASEGVLPLLVMNTVVSITLLKNMVRSVFQIVASETESSMEIDDEPEDDFVTRRISITQFKSLCENIEEEEEEKGVECCVCLCGFKEEEEVSELVSCKHFFHRACLDNWFGNNHTTCPLCRSIL